MQKASRRPLVSQPNLANARWFFPHLFSHLIPSRATNGEIALIHFNSRTGGEPPLHIHTREEEFAYVLEGDFVFESGGIRMQAKQGSFVWFPRNTEHGFFGYGATGKGLLGFIPGEVENWFLQFSVPAEFLNLPHDQAPAFHQDLEKLRRSCEQFGIGALPPTIHATRSNPRAGSKPFSTNRSTAEKLHLPGMVLSFLATSAQTDGILSAFELETDPGFSTPLHTKAETEVVYVLEGHIRHQIGDALVEVGAGSVVLVPANTSTACRNIGPGDSRTLHLICGGQFENLVHEAVPPYLDLESRSEEFAAALSRFGWRYLEPEIAD